MVDVAPLPAGRFGVILADPAWLYRTYSGQKAVPTLGPDPYRTMTLDQLKALKVADLAAKDCALFMWIVDSHLDQGLELGKHWGFRFKTKGFTWRKLTKDGSKARIGMGKWTRKQTEQVYIFTRGHPRVLAHDVREIIDAPIREHSRKPDETYDRIERLSSGPYCELFARQSHPGWTSWGLESTKFDGDHHG